MSRYCARMLVLVLFLPMGGSFIFSQTSGINRENYQIHIKKTDQEIKLDGIFNESPWLTAELAKNFHRVTLTLNDKFFITTFAQYNNRIDNFNLNIRMQWRFAPVSDLYIIYTGNSDTGDFTNKDRGVALKLSYYLIGLNNGPALWELSITKKNRKQLLESGLVLRSFGYAIREIPLVMIGMLLDIKGNLLLLK